MLQPFSKFLQGLEQPLTDGELVVHALRRLKIAAGIGICAYEAAALAVADPDVLPRLTDVAHRWPWLGRAMAGWCLVHLAMPWLWPFLIRTYRGRRLH